MYADLDFSRDAEGILSVARNLQKNDAGHLLSRCRSLRIDLHTAGNGTGTVPHTSRFASLCAGTLTDDLDGLLKEDTGKETPVDKQSEALAWILAHTRRLQSLTIFIIACPRGEIESLCAGARSGCLTRLKLDVCPLFLVDSLPLLYRAAGSLVSLGLLGVVGDSVHNPHHLPCPLWRSLKELEITIACIDDADINVPSDSLLFRFFATCPVLESLAFPSFRAADELPLLLNVAMRLKELKMTRRVDPLWDFFIEGNPLSEVCPRLEHLEIRETGFDDPEFVLYRLPSTITTLVLQIAVVLLLEWLQLNLEDRQLLPNLKTLKIEYHQPNPPLRPVASLLLACKERGVSCHIEWPASETQIREGIPDGELQ